jgi:methionyl-tRNA formyltransferase
VERKLIYANEGWFESVGEVALSLGLPVFKQRIDLALLTELKPDLIVNVSFHQIYKKDLLDRVRIVNLHGSLLPKYRGRSVLNWAIINGEKEVGVTAHYVNEQIDEGDIICQERVQVDLNDTALDVYRKSLPLYPKLCLAVIELIEKGETRVMKQDESAKRYWPQRTPKDSELKELNMPIKSLHDFIRALCDPYPNAFIRVNNKRITFKRSLMKENRLEVSCLIEEL